MFWPAEDQLSIVIMSLFNQLLAAGESKYETMRKAKLTFLEAAPASKSSPLFRNNFLVLGDVLAIEEI